MKIILPLLFCAVLFSCTTPPKKNEAKEYQCTKYACPMHPDKTSTKPGQCPECKMEMTPADSMLKDSVVVKMK